MKTVHEVSQLTGVSVRTLHHYDTIGLLKPSAITEAGYRLYDDEALRRLQSILLYKEFHFSLKDIKAMLDSPDFDRSRALCDQIKLLRLQREHLDRLISFAGKIEQNGDMYMDFSAFNNSQFDAYADEVKARWGGTKEYAQSQKREVSPADTDGLMEVFARFGEIKDTSPDSDAAQMLAAELHRYITDHFYTCSKETFAGLGRMYVEDERFTASIDSKGGAGTAEFASMAIEKYCR